MRTEWDCPAFHHRLYGKPFVPIDHPVLEGCITDTLINELISEADLPLLSFR